MKRKIKNVFKDKYFLLGLIIPLILVGGAVYLTWYSMDYMQKRDLQNFNDGIEVGRFMQLNEDAENTQNEVKQKQALSKTELLKNLAMLESRNGEVRKILDTNNKYSLGLFHFQAGTVKDLYKRYYNQKITTLEAVKIAENDAQATKLAYDAIFVKGEKFHWLISMCRLGEITKNCPNQKQINKLVLK